jgi:uncharacterized membrane protein
MDERRTLRILAWTVGTVVGMMFILNGIALSFVESGPTLTDRQVAAQHASFNPAPHLPMRAAMRGG